MHQLIGKMFLAAFGNPLLETQHDSAVVECDRQETRVHDRFLRRAAAVFSRRRHRLDGRSRHGERPGDERRATALPQRRVHHRGRSADGNALEGRLLDARRGATLRRANHHRRHQGRGQGQGRRPVHQHRRHRRRRTRARQSRRKACGPATRCWSAAIWAGTAWPSWPCAKGCNSRAPSKAIPRPFTKWFWNCSRPELKFIACAT